MRFLFTCIGAGGHFNPLVDIARAAQAAGHEVAFATGAAFCPTVEAAGFRAFSAGFDYAGQPLERWFPQLKVLTGDAYLRFVAGPIRVQAQGRRMVPDLLQLANTTYWPDLIVRDAAEYGGCVAAEVLGRPHASVRTARTPSAYSRRRLIGADLSQLRMQHGLLADPDVHMPFRYLHLACEPPRFSPPDEAAAPTSHLLRPTIADARAGEDLPEWVAALPVRPTVCATLGTFMNRSSEIFRAVLEGVRDEPFNLIVLVGRDIDPRLYGPQPANVRIEQYVPLSLLLPRCDLVVSQAGFSTLCTTLLNGLPSVLIPLGADQPENAQAAARLGVARVVDPRERSPSGIRAAVRSVLADRGYRTSAEHLQTAMRALPGTAHAVDLLERLARDRQPLKARRTPVEEST